MKTDAEFEAACDAMLEMAVEVDDAPAERIYANIEAILKAHEILGHVYNRWLMGHLEDEEVDEAA